MPERHTAQVLIVDRDPAVGREVLAYLRDRGFTTDWVNDGEKAFNRLDSQFFDVLITELRVGRVDGMRLMAVAKERNPDVCVLFTTAKPDIERATEAMRRGAYDFQTKPLNLDKLEAVIQHGLAYQRLVLEQVELRRRLDERFGLRNLVGRSRQMVQVYSAVRQIGPTHEPVLIYGEPGAGKDLIAQAIHNNSPRRDEPFVKLNCAGMPESVIDRELFGVVLANPAGERQTRVGRFELAEHGTLYLEGISELSASLQGKLLEALDRQRIERVGDGKRIAIDIRMVTATNQRLDRLVAAGRFQAELADRLAAVIIEAPALRERREDIPLLVSENLRRIKEQHASPVDGITRTAMNLLLRYDWPGNVRELENVIAGMALTARQAGPLDVNDVPEYVRRCAAPEAGEIRVPTGATMREIERVAIEETLKITGYNKEKCAKILGIGLRTLYRKIKEYNIR